MITRTLEVQNRQENSGSWRVFSPEVVEEFPPIPSSTKDIVNLWAGPVEFLPHDDRSEPHRVFWG